MTNTPFRVLFREFLFRTVDVELLSPTGDTNKLLGQIAALLIFASVGFAIPALGVGSATDLPPQMALMLTWTGEHFLIATTMLVTGLLAVLNWDSTFPNRRDVFVLAPLPIRTRTLFLAKVSAVACALGLTVVALHVLAGVAWPLALHSQAMGQPTPALTYEPALPPVRADGMGPMLDRDLARARKSGSGALAPEAGAGVAVGIVRDGVRRIFAYGTARPDSLFEIGSISKTFTGLLLAQMATREKVALREPVRALLPEGAVARTGGNEITLLDLVTHRSGLPHMPDNINPADRANPVADYRASDLYSYLSKHGLARPANASFEYSNLGFSLLGEALANRAGMSYPELLKQEITGPLGMEDTAVVLSAEQQSRFIQGFSIRHRPIHGWDMDAMAGAGGIRSTAGDMLKFLEAQLHPQKLAPRGEGAAIGSLAAAIVDSHRLRAEVAAGLRIALAWVYSDENGTYWHNGGTGGYSSYAFFHPTGDYAAVILVNQAPGLGGFADILGEHIRQRLAGEPALSLDSVVVPASGGFSGFLRLFAVYWVTMFATGGFIYCCVLGVQGLSAQFLPRRWFLRVSSWLQMAAFCLLVGGYMLQPIAVTPGSILAAQNHGPLFWSPSYWFLGLLQQLNGSPALAPLARRAWTGLTIVLSLTAAAYVLSYFRTLRKIVEEPDIVSSSSHTNLLPRFGNSLAAAVTQFSIRTLLRSRQHRLILAFYWGVALAFVVFITKAPGVQKQLRAGDDTWHQANVPLLVASVLVLCAAIVGMRVVVAMPLELGANWIFRAAPVPGGARGMAAVRRAVYLLGPAPVWCASAALFGWLWPWRAAAGHLAVLGLLGVALTEVCLYGFHKIPFTCSYLPGKSRANMAVLGYLAVVFLIVKGAELERRALEDRAGLAGMVIVLGSVAAVSRWRTSALAAESELRFDEEPEPAIFALDLHRDGTPPLG